MVLLAALIPLLMLGAVLALGRYEELMLPAREDDVPEPAALPAAAAVATTANSSVAGA